LVSCLPQGSRQRLKVPISSATMVGTKPRSTDDLGPVSVA
jgi:hypothetical protein